YKGIEFIYDALKVLKQKGVKFKFTMAGRGPEEDPYVEKFTMLLQEDFEYKGVVSGEGKTKVLQENNVFLLPSFFEGMPVALLESMSFGLVPITTNVGSIKSVITHDKTGIFVKPFSSEEIVHAVERLARDTEFKTKLSINARNHIFNNFKPEEYIVHLNAIYNYE
ncbi:MAG: glycosyltransferase, partial [Sphingobacteriales bacterium]